jgi:uncharacterized protein
VRQVHISIHDVSPAFEQEVKDALAITEAYGFTPALLVVPDYHGRAPLGPDGSYAESLRTLQKRGHEVYLHGLYHRCDDLAAGASAEVSRFFRQKVVSAGEAEFASIAPKEAALRLDQGLECLLGAGLTVSGFVAPAWSFMRWLPHLLATRNMAYTEDHLFIYDTKTRKRKPSLVLNYASRSTSRMLSTIAYCRAAWPLSHVLPTRIAIHPKDMRHKVLRRETERLLKLAKSMREASTADLLAHVAS